MKMKALLAIFMALFVPQNTLAQASPWTDKTGIIQHIWLSQASNYAFRINPSNKGSDQLSSCTADFAYPNASDVNY